MNAAAAYPVLCLGEALVDVVHRGGRTDELVGGSPLNVAEVLAAMGHPTTLAAWWGADARGERIAAHLAEHGVTIAPGSDAASRTSTAQAMVDDQGHAEYTFDIDWQLPSVDTLLAHAGHVHTGSIAATLEPGASAVLAAMTRARESSSTSYDLNARPAIMGEPSEVLPLMERLIAVSDVVKASDEDVAWLYPGRELDDVMREWLERGAALAVVTRGGEGSVARLAADPEPVRCAPLPVVVADTVGAGDSFMGGLLSGLLDAGLLGGRSQADALRCATWREAFGAMDRARITSGLTVTHRGAHAPARAEVLGFDATA